MVDIPNIFAQGMGAYDDQTKRLRQADILRASKQAGAAIASGDYAGGANVFNQAGMVEQGHNVLADQVALEDRHTAAQNAAEDHAAKSRQIKLEGLSKLTDMVASQPAGTRAAYLQQHIPLIHDLLGTDPSAFANMTEEQLSDQSLAGFKAYLGKTAADFTLKGGETRFDGHGKPIAAAQEAYTLKPGDHRFNGNKDVASLPEAQKYMPVTAGGSLVPIPNGNAPPAPVMAPANPTGPDPGAAIDAYAKGGGAVVTSAQRSPEHNAEVGGVPGSHHLTGQARDLIPPSGATVAQLAAELRRRLPGSKVIEESDHVHVQWGGPAAQAAPADGLPAGTIRGPAKPVSRPATAEEKAAYGVAPDVPAQMHPDGTFAVITGTGAAQKRVPPKIQAGYADNAKGMTQIDQAIAAIKANPHALGLKNMFGDTVNQRLDPDGVSTRASVANIGSQIIHDRSGAAVTAAETPRLLPFIPSVNDKPEAAITKLQKLKEQYQNANDQIDIQFGEDSGYAPLGGAGQSAPAKSAPAKPAAGQKTPPITALKADHITTFANGQKWTIRNGQPARVQ